ncbi:MAG: tetratricopeptide repeat protein [Planctomycetaceae bacterium]
MKVYRPLNALSLAMAVAAMVLSVAPCGGCRAISRFGESRQTIAARRLSRQGLEAMHAGQWDVAEGLFAGALDITAADDRAHWGLAESLWQRGERDAALKHMEQAVRLSASDPRLMRRLARMYLDLGRVAEGERQTRAALEADRESAEVWALQGDCLVIRGDQIGALAAYHRALAIQPDYPDVQLQAAELYRIQGRYDRLLATVDRLQDSLGTGDVCPVRGHILRGIALRHLDRPLEAEQCFVEASRGAPLSPDPHLNLAELYLQQDEIVEARQALDQAMLLEPDSQIALDLSRQLQDAESRLAKVGQDGRSVK